MSISDSLAKERLAQVGMILGTSYMYPIQRLPVPYIQWQFDINDINVLLKTSKKQPNHYYINVQVGNAQRNGNQNCLFNIRRFGEIHGDRIDIYQNGDNSTDLRAGTYGNFARNPLVKTILRYYPQLRAAKHQDHVLIGSLPRQGSLSFEDFSEHLMDGLAMHAVVRWAFFNHYAE